MVDLKYMVSFPIFPAVTFDAAVFILDPYFQDLEGLLQCCFQAIIGIQFQWLVISCSYRGVGGKSSQHRAILLCQAAMTCFLGAVLRSRLLQQ